MKAPQDRAIGRFDRVRLAASSKTTRACAGLLVRGFRAEGYADRRCGHGRGGALAGDAEPVRRPDLRRHAARRRWLRAVSAASPTGQLDARADAHRARTRSTIGCAASTPVQTTTWSSRTRSPSLPRAFGRWSRRGRPERPAVLESRWLVARSGDARRRSPTACRSRCRPRSSRCSSLFMRHTDRVLSRSDILDHVWDWAYDGTSNVIDVYVRYLRQKIGEGPACRASTPSAAWATPCVTPLPGACVGSSAHRARQPMTMTR